MSAPIQKVLVLVVMALAVGVLGGGILVTLNSLFVGGDDDGGVERSPGLPFSLGAVGLWLASGIFFFFVEISLWRARKALKARVAAGLPARLRGLDALQAVGGADAMLSVWVIVILVGAAFMACGVAVAAARAGPC